MQILLHPAVADATDTGSTTALSAPVVDNLTGAQLVAALTQRRQAKASAPAPDATTTGTAQTPTTPEPEPQATPAAADAEPDSNATSPTDDPAAPAETSAAATETPPEPEPTPEPEPDPAQPEAKTNAAMLKRIDKLTAKLREAERERDEARAKVAPPDAPPATPEGPPPAALGDAELTTVNADLAKWQRVQTWLKENPGGGDVTDPQGHVVQSVTPEQAEALAAEADVKVAELAAQRGVRLRELKTQHARQQAEAEAELTRRFPWASNPESEQMTYLRNLEQTIPGVKAFPGWKLFAAHAIANIERTRSEEAKPKAKPAAVPPKVPMPAGTAAPRGNPLEKQLAAAEAAFEKSGSHLDGQRVLKLKRELRLTKP